jgi:two-component system phosphate regulon sensor histidine kinase PhoR
VQRPRLLWQVFPLVLGVVAVCMVALLAYAASSVRASYVERSAESLAADAGLLAQLTSESLSRGDAGIKDLSLLAQRIARDTDLRLTVIAMDGTVLVDSHRHPSDMGNHADRPEVVAALEGGIGSAQRYSDTLDNELLYVALPVEEAGQTVAIARTATPLSAIDRDLASLGVRLFTAALLVGLLAGGVAWMAARRIVRPIEDLTDAAGRFAAGDFGLRLPEYGSHEIASLSSAMNEMAREIDERISDLVQQRNEQEAVLSSMVEGVVAVDPDARIITLNEAAAALLGARSDSAVGRSLQEVTRTPELQAFVLEALAADRPLERDLALRSEATRAIQAHGAPVRDAAGERIGAVVVLNDVTRMRRLETVRRDFVANVSHELKTPITSIKGFLETLSEGAIDDPANARRFLEIAGRQADRLGAIIEDLLVLSRLEQEADGRPIATAGSSVLEVLRSAVEICSVAAEARNTPVSVDCPEGLAAPMNAALLEQAVVNLLGNAINYSDPGSPVAIRAAEADGEVRIEVRDQGAGIEARHLPRLFERFYRVDKARSRNQGGTGLGLSIVKHIAQAHGGTVEVASEPGRGSTFTIRIPRAAPAPRA